MATLGPSAAARPARSAARGEVLNRVLLLAGIAYAVLFVVGNDVLAAALVPGYDPRSLAVSELAALGSPARPLALALVPVSTALLVAFGIGVWRAARGRRSLRVAGALVVASGFVGLFSLPFPMTARAQLVAGGAMPTTDVGHVVLTALTVGLIVGMIVASAVPFAAGFRWYSVVSAVVVLLFGALTGTPAPKLAAGASTPWMGVLERISIGAWLLWMVVLAIVLLGARGDER
jgi:hypothetical protein